MNYYMGWQDTRDIPLSQKIVDAMKRYEKKYGAVPNIIELPLGATLSEDEAREMKITTMSHRCIMAGCLLVGVRNANPDNN